MKPESKPTKGQAMEAQARELGGKSRLDTFFQERKINADTATIFDLQESFSGKGIVYPWDAKQYKFKHYNSKATAKYFWCDSTGHRQNKGPETSFFYFAFDLKQAVEMAGGKCWLVSGEPDLWAMRSAGIYHALSGTGETVNSGLISFCHAYGIEALYIAPDLDKTGLQWMQKLSALLMGSGIKLVCKHLPKELGKGGDIGRLWQESTSRGVFERELLSLPGIDKKYLMKPETSRAALPRTHKAVIQNGGEWVLSDLSRQALYSELGVRGFNSSGWSKNNVACPFHDDNTASASVKEWGLYCHTCQEAFTWKDIGDELGISVIWESGDNSKKEYSRNEDTSRVETVSAYSDDTYKSYSNCNLIEVKRSSVITMPASPYKLQDGMKGLSLEAYQALLQVGLVAVAQLLTLLLDESRAGESFTVSELQTEYSPDILSEMTIRNAIRYGNLNGKMPKKWSKRKNHNSHLILFNSYSNSLNTSSYEKLSNGKKRGNTAKVFIVPNREQVYQWLGIEDAPIFPIPRDALRKAKDFRAEVCRALPRSGGRQITNKGLGDLVGVSGQTARNYMDVIDIEVVPAFSRRDISRRDISSYPKGKAELKELRRTRAAYCGLKLVGQTSQGLDANFPPTQDGAKLAFSFAGSGGRVIEVAQKANFYIPLTREEIAEKLSESVSSVTELNSQASVTQLTQEKEFIQGGLSGFNAERLDEIESNFYSLESEKG